MSITIQKKLKNLDLPRSEKQVAVAMAGHLWEKAPERGTWIGAEKIAAECSMGERTVFRAISQLKKKNIMRLIGHRKGVRANMPIYTFHPENGQVLPLFTPEEPANMAESKPCKNLPNTTEEPANDAKNLPPWQQEPATMAGDKGLRKLNEKEERKADPLSYFVWLSSEYDGLNLTGKEKAQIEKLIRSDIFDLSVLSLATARVLDPLDVSNSFDRAGDKLAANLEPQCQAVLKSRENARKTAEMVLICTENEQSKAKRDAEELAARQAAEEELIEESLGDFTSEFAATNEPVICTENG